MKKFLALILSAILVISVFSMNASAYSTEKLTQEEWDTLYSSLKDDNTLPMLCAGADETQLGLVWHAPAIPAKAEVRVSKNSDMSDYVTFTGQIDPSENKEQVVCRVDITGIEENTTYFYQWYTGEKWSEI